MATTAPQAIRLARQRAGLTQLQLGLRLGLKARAVSRWERGDSAPTKRNLAALVTAIAAVNVDVAQQLKGTLFPPPPSAAPAVTVAPVDKAALFEVAVYRMADELDVSPRRVRGPLIRLLRSAISAEISLPNALQQLEARVAEG